MWTRFEEQEIDRYIGSVNPKQATKCKECGGNCIYRDKRESGGVDFIGDRFTGCPFAGQGKCYKLMEDAVVSFNVGHFRTGTPNNSSYEPRLRTDKEIFRNFIYCSIFLVVLTIVAWRVLDVDDLIMRIKYYGGFIAFAKENIIDVLILIGVPAAVIWFLYSSFLKRVD